jgi:hypothetical protein
MGRLLGCQMKMAAVSEDVGPLARANRIMGKHYSPQAYLQGFADAANAKMIWLYDKRTGNFSYASIAKVAQERDSTHRKRRTS